PAAPEGDDDAEEDEGEGAQRGPVQLAVVGRPNVGKATLVNLLLGEERMLTGPEAGLTRESISIDWTRQDRAMRLIDTAGLRRRARIEDKVERLAAADSKRAIDYAQVVVLVIDGLLGMEKQDLTIARTVVEEGRALVIALNKWDAVEDRALALRQLEDRLERS